jgi:hypothetical protein
MKFGLIGVAAALVAPATGLSAAHAAAAPPLSFEGVELGTSEAAWRALKPPGPTPEHARRACSDDRIGAAAGLKPDGLPKDAVICGEVDTYGSIRLPVTFTWDRQYPMDHLRFVFLHGRLSEIRARVSDDAFDALMADFKRSYGAPSRTTRDFLRTEIGRQPRVTETWTLPQGRIELVDPVAPGKISVRVTAPGAKAS